MKTTLNEAKRATPLPSIYRYQLTSELSTNNSGFARWGFATANGKQYFIKEFLSPTCPNETVAISPDILKRKRQICAAFYQRKRRLYDTLQKCSTGNIVTVQDFFLYGTRYYIVTDRVDTASITVSDLATVSTREKLILCKVLANNIRSLHEHRIVHCDIKPNNILIKRTQSGGLTAKLIDFDGSFLLDDPPAAADLQGDQIYIAPEFCLVMNGEETPLTAKADIFSLGLIFHEYFTGRLPEWDTEYAYAHEALLDGKTLRLSMDLPPEMHVLISAMLNVDAEKRPSADVVFDTLLKMDFPPEPERDLPRPPPRPPTAPRSGSLWSVPGDLDF